jgi:Tol biopolymer transport system component
MARALSCRAVRRLDDRLAVVRSSPRLVPTSIVLGAPLSGALSHAAADVGLATAEEARRGAHEMTLVTRGQAGGHANGASRSPVTSADSRYVAYSSVASNLVVGDDNDASDVFCYDAESGMTLLVSHAADGTPASGKSHGPAISTTGRYVAYQSAAGDLAGADETRRTVDVFRYDSITDATILVSRPTTRGNKYEGSRLASISGNGRWVAYASTSGSIAMHDTNRRSDVFVFDASTEETARVSLDLDGSQRRGDSYDPALSSNGRFLAYTFKPAGRHPGAIYRYNLDTKRTVLVSHSSRGVRGNRHSSQPSISGDGHLVAYRSAADNLILDDTNGYPDVFMFNAKTGRTALMSYASDGGPANGRSAAPSLSLDGQFIAFQSVASNLTTDDGRKRSNIYEQFLQVGFTVLISESRSAAPPNGASTSPSISGDGFAVVFSSRASNLVAGDTRQIDIFRNSRA